MSLNPLRTAAFLGALILLSGPLHAAPSLTAATNADTAGTDIAGTDTAGTDTAGTDTAGALTRWQAALDQLSHGHRTEAKILLEQARQRNGDASEINMLLAWLAEQNGQSVSPLLAPIATQSRLALAWSNAPSPVPVAEASALPPQKYPPEVPPAVTASRPGPASAAAVKPVSAQTDARLGELEKFMVSRINEERRALGLKPFAIDSLLADTARAHSVEMRDKRYFAHDSPTATLAEPIDRYRLAFGRTPPLVAENIYRSWGSPRRLESKDVEEAHISLMKSPGHYANIVLPQATRVGIGFAVNGAGDLWVTQMFARG